MKRDAIAELYSIGKMLDPSRGQFLIAEWVHKYVNQCSVRQHSSLIEGKREKSYQEHLDEKSIFQLTSAVIAEHAIERVEETETANIKIKTVFIIGERKVI